MTARWFFGVALLVGLVVASVPASQAEETPTRIFHIGIVSPIPRSPPDEVAFEDRLRELGYVEGRNLAIDLCHNRGSCSLSVKYGLIIGGMFAVRPRTDNRKFASIRR